MSLWMTDRWAWLAHAPQMYCFTGFYAFYNPSGSTLSSRVYRMFIPNRSSMLIGRKSSQKSSRKSADYPWTELSKSFWEDNGRCGLHTLHKYTVLTGFEYFDIPLLLRYRIFQCVRACLRAPCIRACMHALCSVLHAPYSVLRAPCSVLRTPCSVLRAPCSVLLAPCSVLRAPYSMPRAPCSMLRAPCSVRAWVLRAPCSVRGNLWELVGIYGNLWELMGTCGNLWDLMGTYGNLWKLFAWELMGTYGNLWEHVRTYGNFVHVSCAAMYFCIVC